MIKKKICILGAFSVGKTSLVQKFVRSVFSEKYLSTVGVKVDQRDLNVDGCDVSLLIWDISGEDSVQELRLSYLRGAAGYILVADGSRPVTVDTVRSLQKRVTETVGELPFLCVVNKSDLEAEWCVEEGELSALEAEGWSVLRTSAKTGEGVADAFDGLARRLLL